MPEDNNVQGATGQPELVDVLFNGQTVQVTKAHAAVLQDAERSLKQASNQRFEEAARIKKENEEFAKNLEDDITWLNTHDPSMHKNYELKSRGGRGYVNNAAEVDPAMSGEMYNPDTEVRESAKLSGLEAKLQNMEKLLQQFQQKDEEKTRAEKQAAVNLALQAKAEFMKEHKIKPGSSADVLYEKLIKGHHLETGNPPSPREVNEMFAMANQVFGGNKAPDPPPPNPPATGLPKVGGTMPSGSNKEKLDFRGVDGTERFAEHLANTLMSGLSK